MGNNININTNVYVYNVFWLGTLLPPEKQGSVPVGEGESRYEAGKHDSLPSSLLVNVLRVPVTGSV